MQEQKHRGGLFEGTPRARKEWEVVEAIKAGVPYAEISRRYGLSIRTVTNIKNRHGVSCVLRSKCSKSDKLVARRLYAMGLSDVYIANLLGVRASCLFRY